LTGTCLGFLFEGQTKWGHLRTIFAISGVLWISPQKQKYFRILRLGPGTIDSCKKTALKISCYCPFNNMRNRSNSDVCDQKKENRYIFFWSMWNILPFCGSISPADEIYWKNLYFSLFRLGEESPGDPTFSMEEHSSKIFTRMFLNVAAGKIIFNFN